MGTAILDNPGRAWTATDLVARFGPIPLHRVRTTPAPGQATEQDVIDIEARENRLCELIDGVLLEKDMGVGIQGRTWTAADLVARFGPLPLHRVRTIPAPGHATEDDVVNIEAHEKRLFELIDGALVEKDMGLFESFLAMRLGALLTNFVEERKLGMVTGEGGMLRFALGLIYIPDICFISWQRLGAVDVRKQAAPPVIPDLAVEVVSRGNTKEEMAAKLADYLAKGVRLVWYVYPREQEVHVHTASGKPTVLGEADTLAGGEVLPGFKVELRKLFATPSEPRP